MKKKIDADMPGYLILGACNPQMAYKAIEIEPKVGAMLPCNVILRRWTAASRSARSTHRHPWPASRTNVLSPWRAKYATCWPRPFEQV